MRSCEERRTLPPANPPTHVAIVLSILTINTFTSTTCGIFTPFKYPITAGTPLPDAAGCLNTLQPTLIKILL